MTAFQMKLFDLSGTVALVTGGSTGLGRGMALGLAEAGADIVLVDHSKREEIAEEIRALGRRVLSITADLTAIGPILQIVDEVERKWERIDILVNNAGTIRRATALDLSERDWDDVMSLNAKSLFFFAQAVAKKMIPRRRGKIINIASLLSFQGGVFVPSYAASKGAVAQVTKAMANEWAPLGVNVNAIAPGYMATNNTKPLQEDESRAARILARIPAGRWGAPEDLQGAVIYLASHASDYVNGHVLVVDGGWLAR